MTSKEISPRDQRLRRRVRSVSDASSHARMVRRRLKLYVEGHLEKLWRLTALTLAQPALKVRTVSRTPRNPYLPHDLHLRIRLVFCLCT